MKQPVRPIPALQRKKVGWATGWRREGGWGGEENGWINVLISNDSTNQTDDEILPWEIRRWRIGSGQMVCLQKECQVVYIIKNKKKTAASQYDIFT